MRSKALRLPLLGAAALAAGLLLQPTVMLHAESGAELKAALLARRSGR